MRKEKRREEERFSSLLCIYTGTQFTASEAKREEEEETKLLIFS